MRVEIYQGSKLLCTESVKEVSKNTISGLEHGEYGYGEFTVLFKNNNDEDDCHEFEVNQSGLFELLDQLDIKAFNLGHGTEFIFYMISANDGMGTFSVFHDSEAAEDFKIQQNHSNKIVRKQSEDPWFIEDVGIETVVLIKTDDEDCWSAPNGNPLTDEVIVDEDDFNNIVSSFDKVEIDNDED